MNILILNSGSSSIKFQLVKMPGESVICQGLVERIGGEGSEITYHYRSVQRTEQIPIGTHRQGLRMILEYLTDSDEGPEVQEGAIDTVGHRVVHGGNSFSGTVIIDKEVKSVIKKYSPMAPLHNPHNLTGIEIAEELFPKSRQVAVFDTAFHQTMPEIAHRYAIPESLYRDYAIRAYGFHGTSHAYVSRIAQEILESPASRIISVHLGNGCSITAIKDGKSVDHSLGFAPSTGLIMGTRSGDIDHAIIFYLHSELGYSVDEIKGVLDKKSGMLGLTGFSDLREIQAAAANGSRSCQLALEMNAYRIKKYVGSYAAAMNGLDLLIFTAGIGENSSILRSMVCREMDFLGIELDMSKNEIRTDGIRSIDSGQLPVRILVVPTDEEIEIARQAFELCQNL